MPAKPEDVTGEGEGEVKGPVRSKKLLLLVIGAVLLLAVAGGGAFFYISKQRAAAEETDDAAPAKTVAAKPAVPPVYLPLENMVVNLADPGGERVAQVGITLEVADAKAAERVKSFLPTIRSSVLMLISQRTADELLSQEGKKKLAKDIHREALRPFLGADVEALAVEKSKNSGKAEAMGNGDMPVLGVLFSSFIVQ